MARTQTSKTARLEARATMQQKDIIERAAKLRGTSVTDFVVLAAQKEAIETIRDFQTLNLSREASRVFVDALLNPPAPNAALRAAAHRHLSVRA